MMLKQWGWILFSAFSLVAAEKPNTTLLVDVESSAKDGFCRPGEDVCFSVKMSENKQPVKGKFVEYTVFQNGVPTEKKVVSGDAPFQVKTKMDKPGWIFFQALALDENKKAVKRIHPFLNRNKNGGIGVLCGKEAVKPVGGFPADFDEFWKAAIAELKQVPLKAEVKEVELPAKYREKLICYDVKADCAGNAPVMGYLVLPKNAKPKSLPAIVSFHGAGVRGARKQTDYAGSAMCFDVNAHGIENGHDATYYKKLYSRDFQGYQFRNKDDRMKYYYRNMYLRVLRALEYVKSRPEWDGKTLIVRGNSQGGTQAIVAAALDKDVTLCVAGVPALSDHAGGSVGRVPGWPHLFRGKNGAPESGEVARCAQYYDSNNFARRIQCEICLATGGIDLLCPPTSVYTVFNALPEKSVKTIEFFPKMGHNSISRAGTRRIRAVLQGKKVP